MALTADNPMTWLLLVGAVGAYAAVAMAPARLAWVVHLGVTGMVAAGLSLVGLGDAAFAMVSGGAVCVLLLCGGLVLLTGRREAGGAGWGGSAMVVLPVGLVLMFVGLRGTVDAVGVGLLGLLGVVAWLVRGESMKGDEGQGSQKKGNGWRGGLLSGVCAVVLGVMVAVVWGLAVMAGENKGAQFAPAVMGMAILAPAMMFPLVGVSGQAAGESVGAAMSMLLRSAVGLLTVVLPVVIVVGGPVRAWAVGKGLDDEVGAAVMTAREIVGAAGTTATISRAGAATTQASGTSTREVAPTTRAAPGTVRTGQVWPSYPMVSWRMDTAVLVVAGMVLMGMRLGLVSGGRLWGAVAVGAYAVYLVAGVVVAVIL